MSKCLRCGATLPAVGECPQCASQPAHAQAPAAVPELLRKDLQLDRRTRPPAATPPGLTPSKTQAAITPAPSQQQGAQARPLSPPLPGIAHGARPPAIAPAAQVSPPGPAAPAAPAVRSARPAATPDQFPPAWSPFSSEDNASRPVPAPAASAPAPAASPAPAHAPAPAFASAPMDHAAPAARPVITSPKPASALELHARPAPWWRRVLAFTVDALGVAVVLALYLLAATAIAGRPATTTHLTGIDAWVARIHAIEHLVIPGLALAAVLAIAYSAAFGFLWDGRTLGRRLMGIRLVDRTGLAPVPARAILRSVLAIFSFAIFLGGFWLAFFDRKRQTLHDKLTSTYLVQPMN